MTSTINNLRRILLCGVGPVPLGNPDRLYAPGLRVWGFGRALLEAGCRVDLLEVEFGKAVSGGEGRLHELSLDASGECGALEVFSRPRRIDADHPVRLVKRCLAEAAYDAVVSTTDVMNDACARVVGDKPLWCDFFGHPMAERQSMAYALESDEGLADQWDYILAPLLRADHLSGCSQAQRFAILGEMGACGRLNRWTDGIDLVSSLPPAVLFPKFEKTGSAFRGKDVPDDAFVVLWTGGYNTWADPLTLADGLLRAMEREPRLRFVSTGGAIAGHDNRTFERFQERIQASHFVDRFHFSGWVETRDVPDYYLEADVGINCERCKLEGELGTRNRVIDWICAGLPVVSTNVCELTQDLASRKLIDTFPAGDAEAMADALVRLASSPIDEKGSRTEKARLYLLENYLPGRLFEPMMNWARSPVRAPDVQRETPRDVPFAVPNNPLAHRRFREWRRSLERASGAIVPVRRPGILGRLFRKLRG
ncbi:glycosyltransferase family 4 protein [bacterium]|nr:glycosyltransferase family 4 protein [bacterium]